MILQRFGTVLLRRLYHFVYTCRSNPFCEWNGWRQAQVGAFVEILTTPDSFAEELNLLISLNVALGPVLLGVTFTWAATEADR